MLRKAFVVLILIAALLAQQPSFAVSASPDQATFVTLYAHAHPGGEPGTVPILNALQEWGPQQAARLQEGEAVFSLDPPLGNDLIIDGTTTIRLWVKSDFRLVGFLAVYLSATSPNGTSIFTHAVFNDTVYLDTRARDFNYLVAINNLILIAGSTILLHVKLTSQDKVTNVSLLYDSQGTPTQITLPIVNATNATARTLTDSGLASRIFEAGAASNNATVRIEVRIIDALGLYRLKSVSLSIVNSSGAILVNYGDILPRTVTVSLYNATFEGSLTLPSSAYKLLLIIADRSGNRLNVDENFYVAPYFVADIRVVDATNRPVSGAQVVLSNAVATYSAEVNETGLAAVRVPSSRIVGTYQLTVLWKNQTVSQSALSVSSDTSISVFVEAYDLMLRVRLFNFDLPGTRVDVFADSKIVSSGLTNSTGVVTLTQIPPGKYDLDVHYLGVRYQTTVDFARQSTITIQVPIPYQDLLPYIALLAAAAITTAVVLRRRRIYRWPFDYINVLTKGGVPDARTTVIAGNSGSGKTVLMGSLAYQSLLAGRGCVYVSNVELPSDVRVTMKSMGMDTGDHEIRGKLIFIDCYSSLSGTASKEKRFVDSITDLTSLGIQITRSIEEIGGTTDVYFDALTPLFTALRPEYVLNFLQSVGAKVKSYNGGLCTIIGTSVEKEILTRVEEGSDCLIETQLSEGRTGQRRRLRIKKLRGHPYDDAWTRFIITDQGITFYTRKPPPQT